MWKVLSFEEFRPVSYKIECTLNSRPLTYVDEDFHNNILTPNHLIYGCNINDKCFNDSSSAYVNVIRGRDNLIRGVELRVFHPKLNHAVTINGPLQLITPLEINKNVESLSKRPRKVAAVNADIKRKLTNKII